MVIFSPWAFGATQGWSVWTMNISAYGLGVLLVSKLVIRWLTGFRPWQNLPSKNEISPRQYRLRQLHKTCTVLSAVLMILLLGYILTSAINARASFNLETHEYTYFEGINKSLPHSYDANGTWFLFWQYLGLIILFWSTWDWLMRFRSSGSLISINPRLKRLIFVICLNGGALALECILQRIYYKDSSGKLLFLIEPLINNQNIVQFGPFAYRSNAASYLNLVWPLGVGFLIVLGNKKLGYLNRRFGSGAEFILIPCVILAASGPIISSSMGGILTMIGLIILVILITTFLHLDSRALRVLIWISLISGILLGVGYGWKNINHKISVYDESLNNRKEIFEITKGMINDYGFFGSGPGSFQTVYMFEIKKEFDNSFYEEMSGRRLDRINKDNLRWASWAHCDYLEFYLTFGKAGGFILIALTTILLLQFLPALLVSPLPPLELFGFISIIGAGVHASLDYPLQVFPILNLIVLILAYLSTNNCLAYDQKATIPHS